MATTQEIVTTLERARRAVDGAEVQLTIVNGDYEKARKLAIEHVQDEIESVPLVEDTIRELARIRTALKAGKHDEARERLECCLDQIDSAWRIVA